MADSQDGEIDHKEWLIHLFRCPDCGTKALADRPLGCFQCGETMEQVEWAMGELEVPSDAV